MAAVMGPWAPMGSQAMPTMPMAYPQNMQQPAMGGYPPQSQQPLMPRMNFPPQPMMDFDPRDGPASVAYNLQPTLKQVRQQRPAPWTRQYFNRVPNEPDERVVVRPRVTSDICGYIQAAVDNRPDPEANRVESEMYGVHHNDLRLVYGCLSGWCLMFWRSQEEFLEGVHGGRRAPRSLAWWDLRNAHDVDVECGALHGVVFPHRFRIMTAKGNIFFRVELAEDVPIWYTALSSLIQDAQIETIACRDSEVHQRKRWPAACGLARALLNGMPIGERAMAIAFHAYDIDYDLSLKAGELMILIKELVAAMFHEEQRAEGVDRNTAVICAESRLSEDELYERAVQFRRRCAEAGGDAGVTKDGFILRGQSAMLEALDMGGGEEGGEGGGDVCSVM